MALFLWCTVLSILTYAKATEDMFLSISLFITCNSYQKNTALDKPNIVFIMADDLGWANVGFHNKENPEIQTPNIDYLALNGLELNRHYVDAECTPSRSSFQSGRMPIYNLNNNNGLTNSTAGIPPDMTCIATKLKAAGYATHMVGKWGVGFASPQQLPIARGYDTSYGYLNKNIDYFDKTGGVCTNSYIDLWANDAPAAANMEAIDDEYVEYVFAEKVLTTIDKMAAQTQQHTNYPFFIFYASHLPHYPAQLPEDCVEKGYYTYFDDDENQCNTDTQWECRAILQAQVAMLDDIVGQITAKLKETELWEDTLIVFSTDNGGSLELEATAGNNYPLRGGKATFLEGGIRATSLVSGGYLPEARHGSVETGLMHISDWYVTFSEMLGVDPSDYAAKDKGLPDVDGYNMWPMIAGYTDESPRDEVLVSENVLIVGEYKLIVGSPNYAIWQSPIFPNGSTSTQEVLSSTVLACDSDSEQNGGCLFNVVDDPGEHNDLADEMPHIVTVMKSRLEELKDGIFDITFDFEGKLACPDNFVVMTGHSEVETACGCWMAVHNWGMFLGPYMDLEEDQIHYDKVVMDGMVRGIMIEKVRYLQDFKSNYVIYIAVIAAATILVFGVMRNCEKRQKTQTMKQMYGSM